ncbi:MAG: hypothetical protein ABIK09_19090, partial [Pseudomonadota bacterium]
MKTLARGGWHLDVVAGTELAQRMMALLEDRFGTASGLAMCVPLAGVHCLSTVDLGLWEPIGFARLLKALPTEHPPRDSFHGECLPGVRAALDWFLKGFPFLDLSAGWTLDPGPEIPTVECEGSSAGLAAGLAVAWTILCGVMAGGGGRHVAATGCVDRLGRVLAVDLLVLDDFGLHPLPPQAAQDLY